MINSNFEYNEKSFNYIYLLYKILDKNFSYNYNISFYDYSNFNS